MSGLVGGDCGVIVASILQVQVCNCSSMRLQLKLCTYRQLPGGGAVLGFSLFVFSDASPNSTDPLSRVHLCYMHNIRRAWRAKIKC